jgi:hypothetical protein
VSATHDRADPPLDDRVGDRLLAGSRPAGYESLADLLALIEDAAQGPAPVPARQLAGILELGLPCPVAAPPAVFPRARRRWPLRVGAGVAASLAVLLSAAAANALPAPMQRVVSGAVEALTPFHVPAREVPAREVPAREPTARATAPAAGRTAADPPGQAPDATDAGQAGALGVRQLERGDLLRPPAPPAETTAGAPQRLTGGAAGAPSTPAAQQSSGTGPGGARTDSAREADEADEAEEADEADEADDDRDGDEPAGGSDGDRLDDVDDRADDVAEDETDVDRDEDADETDPADGIDDDRADPDRDDGADDDDGTDDDGADDDEPFDADGADAGTD